MNEIIDVLLRILSVLVLFISCGLLVYFSHEKLKVSLINQQDPIVTVPLDAGIVVESNKLKATLLNMSETNLIWSKLLEYQAFKEFDQLIKELDVFITKEQIIDESLNNKKIIVSFHPGNNGSEIFVAINNSKEVYEAILSLLEKEGYIYKQIENSFIESIDKSGNKFFISYRQPFITYSSSRTLIEESLKQQKRGDGLHKNTDFIQVNSTKSFSSDIHVFLQSKQVKRIAANFLTNDAIQIWQEGAFFNGWMALDFNAKPNSLQVSGLSLLTNPGVFGRSINRQKPLAKKNYNLLPANTNTLRSYCISNFSDFMLDHGLIDPSVLDESCQCNSVDLLENLIGNELIYVELEIRDLRQKAMLFKKADEYTSARSSLQILGKGDSLLNKVDGKQVYLLKSNLFAQTLGFKLDKADLCFQELDGYVILSSEEGIRAINKANKKNKQNKDFSNFNYYSKKYFTNYSTIDHYWSKNEFFNEFKVFVKNEYQDNFQRLSSVLSEIDGISFQASSSSKDFNFHSYAMSTGNSTVEESSQLWIAEIDSISRAPELMKNHRTNTLELLVQDENNVIYLISATGKVKWSKQLEGQIIGEVKQMDFYKNAKWQMLFNTESKIHLIDVNGNEVSGFPFQLKSPATNTVSVFDYENKGNYRFLVCAEDKKMYNFDKAGKSLPDWNYPNSKNKVYSPIQHIVAGQKDYLFSYDSSGHVYLYDRRGNVRYNSSIFCKPNKIENFRFKKDVDIENSSVTYIDSSNIVMQFRFNAVSDTLLNPNAMLKELANKEYETHLNFLDMAGNEQLMHYSISNGQKIEIYGPDKELQFIEYLDFVIGDNVKSVGIDNRYILIGNKKLNEIYLYDSDYNLTNVHAMPGSFRSIVGDMNFDGVDELITVTDDNKIIAYSIEANFN